MLSGSDYYTSGNLAPKLQPSPRPSRPQGPQVIAPPAGASAPAPAPASPNLARAVQVPLFRERGASNVIPFETYAPSAPAAPRTSKPAAPRPKRAPRVHESQGSLDFLPPAPPAPKKLGTTVEAMIYCDAPVAHVLHRAVAAAIDWSMVLIGCGLFLLAFRLLGGPIVLSSANLPMFGGTFALIALMYGITWTLAGVETMGMRAARLRLISFDGFAPEPRHRWLRLLGSCLSYGTGLGLLWSLADEENLGWQDHISRTFPTYQEFDKQTFHQH